MPTDHRTAPPAKIKRFAQLISLLRDEMGWPIESENFEDVDDLFYDFTADELGIDTARRPPRFRRSSAYARSPQAALGHLLRQVRAKEVTRRRSATYPEPGRPQETRVSQ